jgi:hypothetical protein
LCLPALSKLEFFSLALRKIAYTEKVIRKRMEKKEGERQ